MSLSLKELIQSLSKSERDEFAASTRHSLGHIRNVMHGYKECSPELAAYIETTSRVMFGQHRTVKRWDLIPDRWHLIWPELVGADGAPEVPQATEQAA